MGSRHSPPTTRHFSRIADLLAFLGLDKKDAPFDIDEKPDQPLLVPRSFAESMRKGDWSDPLLLQVLPRGEERIARRGFCADPLGESLAEAAPGVLHKYESRALLLASQACSIRCRFCFRRAYPFRPAQAGMFEPMLGYCRRTTSLREVILSGGDPLCLPDDELCPLLDGLASIPHIATVRIHTRLPVADPGALGDAALGAISRIGRGRNVVVVVHANHAAEIGEGCRGALAKLRSAGALLLSQSVLLRSVNDNAPALADLSRALLDNGVVPYYLHQLDHALGTSHFEVPLRTGREIVRRLREMLPGYAVPRYVREIPGEKAKRPL